ncbi:MAG: tetratricopeptide repeat protein [Bradymonadia bacterium]
MSIFSKWFGKNRPSKVIEGPVSDVEHDGEVVDDSGETTAEDAHGGASSDTDVSARGGDFNAGGFHWETPPRREVSPPATPISDLPGDVHQGDVHAEALSGVPEARLRHRLARRRLRPLAVPSLAEQALMYQIAAEDAGHSPRAVELWDAHLEMVPDDGEAWLSQGQALDTLGNFSGARGAYMRATECLEDDPRPWTALGHLAADQGDYEEAVAQHERALAAAPGHPDLLLILAEAQERAGLEMEAIETRRRLTERR